MVRKHDGRVNSSSMMRGDTLSVTPRTRANGDATKSRAQTYLEVPAGRIRRGLDVALEPRPLVLWDHVTVALGSALDVGRDLKRLSVLSSWTA